MPGFTGTDLNFFRGTRTSSRRTRASTTRAHRSGRTNRHILQRDGRFPGDKATRASTPTPAEGSPRLQPTGSATYSRQLRATHRIMSAVAVANGLAGALSLFGLCGIALRGKSNVPTSRRFRRRLLPSS